MGEVAQSFSTRPDLLGVEAKVVGVGEHLLQGEAGLVEAPGAGKALHKPEGTEAEAPFLALQAVGGGFLLPVAVHERVVGQLLLYTVEGGEPAGVGGTDELHQGHEKERSVEGVGTVVLDEAVLLPVPALFHDLLVDHVPLRHPASVSRREPALAGDAPRALEGDPAHDLRRDELPLSAADLPDTMVRILPVGAEPAENPPQVLPEIIVQRSAVPVVEVRRVEDGPVEVELDLAVGGVAEPDRTGVLVAGEVVEYDLGEVGASVYAVERLEETVPIRGAAVPQPIHKVSRFIL